MGRTIIIIIFFLCGNWAFHLTKCGWSLLSCHGNSFGLITWPKVNSNSLSLQDPCCLFRWCSSLHSYNFPFTVLFSRVQQTSKGFGRVPPGCFWFCWLSRLQSGCNFHHSLCNHWCRMNLFLSVLLFTNEVFIFVLEGLHYWAFMLLLLLAVLEMVECYFLSIHSLTCFAGWLHCWVKLSVLKCCSLIQVSSTYTSTRHQLALELLSMQSVQNVPCIN